MGDPAVGDLPLGEPVDWTPARRPERAPVRGRYVMLRPLQAGADAEPLYAESHEPSGDARIWTYLPDGPYPSIADYVRALEWEERSADPLYFALVPLPGERAAGQASFLNIKPDAGSIEIGHIWFGPSLRRTRAATEAIYLMIRCGFDELGYRRVEWMCNALNAPSRAAAERFGFTFEGIARNHRVVKGRSRDTASFSITDAEWPAIRAAFERWLDPANFEPDGRQRRGLKELMP